MNQLIRNSSQNEKMSLYNLKLLWNDHIEHIFSLSNLTMHYGTHKLLLAGQNKKCLKMNTSGPIVVRTVGCSGYGAYGLLV